MYKYLHVAKESYEVKKSSFWRLQSAGMLHQLAGDIVPCGPQWHTITSHKNLNLWRCHCINIKSQYLTSPYRPETIKKIMTDRKCGLLNGIRYGAKCVLAWRTAGVNSSKWKCVYKIKLTCVLISLCPPICYTMSHVLQTTNILKITQDYIHKLPNSLNSYDGCFFSACWTYSWRMQT